MVTGLPISRHLPVLMKLNTESARLKIIITVWHCLALKQFYIKNVGLAKIQRVQQKIPGCWTYVQQNKNKFQKVWNTSLKLPVGVSPLQLVNLHRNQRYFVIKLHTCFCLSYFLKTNIKFYCIYQYFMSINSFFNTVSVSRYSHPITVTCDPD